MARDRCFPLRSPGVWSIALLVAVGFDGGRSQEPKILNDSQYATTTHWKPKEIVKKTFYRPENSGTFKYLPVKRGGVSVNYHYADGSAMVGFDGSDVVQLGNFRCVSRMAFATEATSGDFDVVDGILGWGFTKVWRNPALFYTLSERYRADWGLHQGADMQLLHNHVFSVLASNETSSAELQLGGTDPNSYLGPMFYASPMEDVAGYGVQVYSLKYDGVELFQFSDVNKSLTAVMDSGSSCLILPATNVNGTFTGDSPYAKWQRLAATRNASFVFDLGGREFELTFDDWFMGSCVDSLPFQMLFGNVLFRKFVIEYNLDASPPKMGIAPRNPKYVFRSKPGTWNLGALEEAGHMVPLTKIPMFNYRGKQFHVQIGVGTPPQPLTVIFDTGSYMLAIFVHRSSVKHVVQSYDVKAAAKRGVAAPTEAHSMTTKEALGAVGVAVLVIGVIGLLGFGLLRGPCRKKIGPLADDQVPPGENYGSTRPLLGTR